MKIKYLARRMIILLIILLELQYFAFAAQEDSSQIKSNSEQVVSESSNNENDFFIIRFEGRNSEEQEELKKLLTNFKEFLLIGVKAQDWIGHEPLYCSPLYGPIKEYGDKVLLGIANNMYIKLPINLPDREGNEHKINAAYVSFIGTSKQAYFNVKPGNEYIVRLPSEEGCDSQDNAADKKIAKRHGKYFCVQEIDIAQKIKRQNEISKLIHENFDIMPLDIAKIISEYDPGLSEPNMIEDNQDDDSPGYRFAK